MLTVEQKRGIRDVTGFPMRYQDDFDRRWEEAVERMRGSGTDLGAIALTIEWSGAADVRRCHGKTGKTEAV